MATSRLASEDQRHRDDEHLKLLSIFHFVVSGLALVGIPFLYLHYSILNGVFSDTELWNSAKGANAPPRAMFEHVFHFFIWIYIVMAVALVVASVLNFASGMFLRQRKQRMFSMIVAGLNCLQVPFGTALGVCTFVVLQRDSVRQSYLDSRRAGRTLGR